MGYGNSYFAQCAKRGSILPVDAEYLRLKYNIEPEDYAPREAVPPKAGGTR